MLLEAIAEVAREGGECVGICERGVSFIDVIEASVRAFGGCDLVVCSGAVHESSAKRLIGLASGELWVVLSCELLKMNPLSFRGASRVLGDRLLLARTHAKFAVLIGAERTLVVLTTANLNENRRHESYTATSDPALAFELVSHCADLEAAGAVPGHRSDYYLDSFAKVLGGGKVEVGGSLADLIRRV